MQQTRLVPASSSEWVLHVDGTSAPRGHDLVDSFAAQLSVVGKFEHDGAGGSRGTMGPHLLFWPHERPSSHSPPRPQKDSLHVPPFSPSLGPHPSESDTSFSAGTANQTKSRVLRFDDGL